MQPKAKFRKDYQAPDFTITDIYLDFQLDPQNTLVTSTLSVKRQNESATQLKLDGHSFEFVGVKFNGEAFSAYQKDDESLMLNLADFPAEQLNWKSSPTSFLQKIPRARFIPIRRRALHPVRGGFPPNYLSA